jgi:hypothetical protein
MIMGVASAGVLDVSRADGILANNRRPYRLHYFRLARHLTNRGLDLEISASSASCPGTLFVLHVGPPWQMLP